MANKKPIIMTIHQNNDSINNIMMYSKKLVEVKYLGCLFEGRPAGERQSEKKINSIFD
jgi:hypothetical protein